MISGYALHSGVFCEVRLHLAEGPVRFRLGHTEIPAHADYVTHTQRSTTLGKNGVHINLVEHFLAALNVKGWWRNIVIEVSANELPILDGSSLGWLETIDGLGPAPSKPEPLTLTDSVTVSVNESYLCAGPGPASLSVEVDYEHPMIGKQHWQGSPEDYASLLDARTFGFLKDLDMLKKAGLATHASLENAMVFDDTGPLTPLRYADEPVRHKALDVLGDLFLLGRPIQASLEVSKGSHQSHVALVKRLLTLQPSEQAEA